MLLELHLPDLDLSGVVGPSRALTQSVARWAYEHGAAGVLYPAFGLRLSPIIAAAAMAASSLSVVGNANRLRRYHPAPLPPAGQVHAEPLVETPRDRTETIETITAPVTDPVCGMTVDPATAAAQRGTGPDAVYFCSAGCAAAYDADPGRYAEAAATAPGAATR